ncbi:hypothetical protein LINGRAHAP2_LOCUS4058, partial [Linum grandiflorum]
MPLSRDSFMMSSITRMEKYCAIAGCEHLGEFHAQRRTQKGIFWLPTIFAKGGCGYFVWFEVKVAALNEKQELVQMVDNLQLQVRHMKEENEWLQTQMDDGVASSGNNVVQNNKYNLTAEIEMLKFRVG